MAIVKRQIFGSLKGIIGDVVYKHNKGTNYTSIRPKKYKKTKSPHLIKNRNKFSRRVAFCRFILTSPLLKIVWKTAKVPGKYAYHKIFKYNYRSITNERIHYGVNILPENILVRFNNYKLNEDSFSYDFISNKNFSDNSVPPYFFIAFIYMYLPVDVNSKRKEVFILLEEESKDFVAVMDKPNHFKFKIAKSSFKIMEEFQKIAVFPAIVAKNKKDKLVWANDVVEYVRGEPEKPVPSPVAESPKSDEPYRSFIINIK